MTFAEEIRLGIPEFLPEPMPYDNNINHAPKRKEILTPKNVSWRYATLFAIFLSSYMRNWLLSLSTS